MNAERIQNYMSAPIPSGAEELKAFAIELVMLMTPQERETIMEICLQKLTAYS